MSKSKKFESTDQAQPTTFKPVDMVSDDSKLTQNKLLIHDESGVVNSITDNMGSYSNELGQSPTRTEIENRMKAYR